jgi:hypothetical protein
MGGVALLTQGGDCRLDAIHAPRSQNHRGAGTRKNASDMLADPARGSGDESRFAVQAKQVFHHIFP